MANQAVRNFALPASGGGAFELSKSDARILVFYFYPKDNTPGCTTETLQFRDLQREFQKAGARIYGISRDSLKSHASFKAKLKLPFELLADEDETVCQQFGVIKMKNMYGRQVRGIERSTFVLDAGRTVCREWRGVKVPGHAKEVLDFVKTL
jgi:peroxiredoxin Q/BCP